MKKQVRQVYPDVPVSALRHFLLATVCVADREGPPMVTGILTGITLGERADVRCLLLGTDTVASVLASDHVTVIDTVALCDEHGLTKCECPVN